jgi:hypothetical protein
MEQYWLLVPGQIPSHRVSPTDAPTRTFAHCARTPIGIVLQSLPLY